MWSVQQTWKLGRRAAGFLGGLLVALLLAAAQPGAAQTFSSFSDPDPLSNTVPMSSRADANTPAVAVTTSGQVYVAWKEGDDIFFTRSVPSRGSCTGPGRLEFAAPAENLSTVDPAQAFADSPSIAVNDGTGVFVLWRLVPRGTFSTAVQSIRFRRSIDGGVTFKPVQPLDSKGAIPNFPAIAADNSGGVFVAWQDFLGTRNSVLMAQSLDEGASFTYADVTANRLFSSGQPSVAAAADGSKGHVVWRETATLSRGVWYKGFTPGSGWGDAIRLTTSPVLPFPKIAVHGSEVTAAWFEGTTVKARTATGGNFGPDPSVLAETIYGPVPSTTSLSNLSLSFGGSGRFVAWQEAAGSTRSIRYRLGTADPATVRSSSETNPAAPSAGQDGTGRLVASWQENGTGSIDIKLAHTGGSGGVAEMPAEVRVTPQRVNLRTMDVGTGQPSFTVFVQLPRGSEIDEGSVKMNGQSALRGSIAVGDHNGDGYRDVMVKFSRSSLKYNEKGEALTVPTGKYKVTGTMTGGGCFSGGGTVEITP